jgi:hypothetical protein
MTDPPVLVGAVVLAAVTSLSAARPVRRRCGRVSNCRELYEGPAFDRCQIEATLERNQTTQWRVFFGEVRADANSGWSAIRPSSGCAQATAERAAATWTLRGSPYFLVDVAVGKAGVSGREVLIEAALSIQKLTSFAQGGAPVYEMSAEKRTLRVPEGGSAVVPILIASPREVDELGVRELLLKFRASAVGSGRRSSTAKSRSRPTFRGEIFSTAEP